MIKDKIDKIVKNYSDRESMKNGNDFVEYFETFKILKENFNETLKFLMFATIDEIEIISFIMKELICFYKSQKLLDIFKKFVGSEFKYICADSFNEDVEDAQYILDNNIEIPVPNPAWL